MLAELAVNEPAAFATLVKTSNEALDALPAREGSAA